MSRKHEQTQEHKEHHGHHDHEHEHEHGQGNGHKHKHEHEHKHKHEHEHEHEHEHDHEHLAHDDQIVNSHTHCHEHSHGDSYTHCHEHKHSQAGHHANSHRCTPRRVLTLRPHCGLSGDMMLAGLAVLAGVDTVGLHALAAELKIPALEGCVALEPRSVNSVAGYGCTVTLPHEHAHRTLADIRTVLEASALPEEARGLAVRCFELLAEAEAAVHGKSRDDVTFHEVGALDSILDIALVCRLYTLLAPPLRPLHLVCGPLPVADGQILCAHGHMPSPAPAVLRLLEGVPVAPFAGQGETVTPTALALLKALGATFGRWPAMTVQVTTISYGTKVFEDAPNGLVWALGEEL